MPYNIQLSKITWNAFEFQMSEFSLCEPEV